MLRKQYAGSSCNGMAVNAIQKKPNAVYLADMVLAELHPVTLHNIFSLKAKGDEVVDCSCY